MTHVGGEARVAFDASLQRGRHVVERTREGVEIRIVGGLEARLEPSAGDRLGGLAGGDEWSNGARRRDGTEHDAEQRGDGGGEHQRQPDAAQRALDVVEGDEIEVGAVDLRKRYAHGQDECRTDLDTHE